MLNLCVTLSARKRFANERGQSHGS